MRQTNRMIFPFSHDARMIRQQNRLALVNVLAAIFCLDKRVILAFDGCSLPSDAGSVLIDKVLGFVYRAKIADAVVGFVSVDVVDFFSRLFAAREKPSYAMGEIRNTFVFDSDVAFEIGACNISSLNKSTTALKPNKFARFGAVVNRVLDRYRYFNHAPIIQGGSR